jgi:hypothetical protein
MLCNLLWKFISVVGVGESFTAYHSMKVDEVEGVIKVAQ